MPYINAEVHVDLSDFDTDDLVEELESRGIDINTKGVDGDAMCEILMNIYEARRVGRPYDRMIDEMIWEGLGRVL